MAISVWDYIYNNVAALKKRGRLFMLSAGVYTEATNPVSLSTKITTNASGSFTLNYASFGFAELYDVQLTPIVAAAGAANAITYELVGDPTLTQLTIQTYKPAVIVLGGLALAAAASVPVFVSIRGRLA